MQRALERVAPAGVLVGARAVDVAHLADLPDEEAALVAGAVERRRAELATGRSLLRQLTGAPGPIARLSNGAPALPDGFVGSLAHDRDVAAAAVAPRSVAKRLGVDLEVGADLTDDEAAVVCRPEERHLDPRLVFVLKEAAYKAWSVPGTEVLGHHDVAVAVDGDAFEATVLADGTTLSGRWTTAGERLLALVVDPT